MRKLLFLMAVAAFCLNCGTKTETTTAVNKTNTAAPANTSAPAKTPAPTNTSAPSNTNAASKTDGASNPELDFAIVNKTGYDIKELSIGSSGINEWTKEMEVLKGRKFADGSTMEIKFDPRAKAEMWDVKVVWADGSGSEEWLKLKLTEIEKITLVYDKDKDETSAITE